jgi:hypothetical protein
MKADPVSRPCWQQALSAVERLSEDDYEALERGEHRHLADDCRYVVFNQVLTSWRTSFGPPNFSC